MLLLIDIFSINKSRGHENPSLKIIVTERCSTRGCPLKEACEHFFLNQSVISIVVLILFMCYCGWLCWLYYCYSTIPSILFMFCVFIRSGILQVVSEHFPWQKLWVFFFRVEMYSDVFKPQRSVITRISPRWRDSYMQEIQVVLKRTSVGHPCNPYWYPFEW